MEALRILYRDDTLLVVNKPAGLLTHRSELAPDSDVAMTRARDAIGARVWPLHRLDRGTSGALAFALSEPAARALRARMEAGEVDKEYLALARGITPEAIVVDYPVPRAEGGERVSAITRFRRLCALDGCSLVEARPSTGRYHQIRRHLSHLRHPIACDSNYGTGWFNRKIRAETSLKRLGLHALRLTFHFAGAELVVRAPLPEDFAGALRSLGAPPELVHALVASRV